MAPVRTVFGFQSLGSGMGGYGAHGIWGPTRLAPEVEIHVYGLDLRELDRCRHNLETGAISPSMTREYANCLDRLSGG